VFAVFESEDDNRGFILPHFASGCNARFAAKGPRFFKHRGAYRRCLERSYPTCRSSRGDSARILRGGHHAETHALDRRFAGAGFQYCLDVELDSLCQRQIQPIVHGLSLPAHIRLPTVRARLPTASGLFLASECTADLGTTGTHVDIRDAAVRAPGRQKGLGFSQVGRENGRRQALRHAL